MPDNQLYNDQILIVEVIYREIIFIKYSGGISRNYFHCLNIARTFLFITSYRDTNIYVHCDLQILLWEVSSYILIEPGSFSFNVSTIKTLPDTTY